MFNIKRKNEFSEEKCSVFLNRQNKNAPGIPGRSCLKRKEKKLKYFEGVHRSVWTLRCVSYEMYQLFAATVLLYPENVSKICSSDKEYMNSGERGKSPFQLKGSWV